MEPKSPRSPMAPRRRMRRTLSSLCGASNFVRIFATCLLLGVVFSSYVFWISVAQEHGDSFVSVGSSSTETENNFVASNAGMASRSGAGFRTQDFGRHDWPPLKQGHPPPHLAGGSIKERRIAVTGGAGFIGSHLVDKLMEQGHFVIVIDNLFTGHKSNLQKWLGHPRFEFILHDVTLPINLEVDQIYHLACPASPVHYKYNPVKTLKTSFLGTMRMLGLARRVKARFLLASTSEVYGDPLVHPQTESYWGNVNPIGERSCYDEGKRVAETLTMDYHRQEGIDVRIARIFNTYGPRMALHDGRVVSNFVGQAIRGEKLTVQGNGAQTRSFCFISDMVDGLIRLMNSNYSDSPVNIGNPGEFTILELSEVVKEVVNPNVEVEFVPLTPDDPKQRKPVIDLAKEVLGWEPKVQLREGIAAMAEDFRSRIGSE